MRIEKEGPPYRADGSLDYTQSKSNLDCPLSIRISLFPAYSGRPVFYLLVLCP